MKFLSVQLTNKNSAIKRGHNPIL